jgi:uncharacterized membrane protein YjgN (DUF898 family)
MKQLIIWFVLVAAATVVAAQTSTSKESKTIDWDRLEKLISTTPAPSGAQPVAVLLSGGSGIVTRELEAYFVAGLKHRQATFAWQLTASRIIFWIVIILVLAGVGFAAIQFWVALRRREPLPNSEISINDSGVVFRSQYLGVLTLAISLAFFYLYLKTVYPVVELGDAPVVLAPRDGATTSKR